MLFPRSNVERAMQFPSSAGIAPSRRFEFKFNTERDVKLPIASGILPLILLLLRTSLCNNLAFPISTGSVPSRRLFAAESSIKLVEFHKLTGTEPVKLFESNSRTMRGSSERKLFPRSTYVEFFPKTGYSKARGNQSESISPAKKAMDLKADSLPQRRLITTANLQAPQAMSQRES
nr:hypothetical protein PanWU01x14_192820 [Ipomoea batatas]